MRHAALVILALTDTSFATETIEIRGSRVDQFSEQRAEHLELNKEDISNSGASNLAEVLEMVPGIRITKGIRGDTLTILGLGGRYVKININGSPIGGRISGSYDLSRIKLGNVKRIEIIKGPSSSLHGSDAMGGLINIVTDWNDQSLLTTGVKGDSNGESYAFTTLNQQFDDSQLHLTTDYSNSLGYTIKDKNGSFKAPQVEEASVRLQYGLDINDKNSLSLITDLQSRKFEVTEYYATGGVFDRSNDIVNSSVQIQNDYNYSDNGYIRAMAAINTYEDVYFNDQRGDTALDDRDPTNQALETYGLDVLHQLGDHELAGGLELTASSFESGRLAEKREYHRDGYAIYFQDRWQLSDMLVTWGTRQEQDSQYGSHNSKKFSLNYKLNKTARLVATYSEGFRAPDVKELHMSFVNSSVGYEVAGNPDLKPEDTQYYVLEYRDSQGAFHWAVRAFQNQISNLISPEAFQDPRDSTRILYRYTNIYSAEITGAAAELQYLGSEYYSMSLGYTYKESRDGDSSVYLADRPLSSTKLNLLLTATPALRFNLSASHYGSRAYYPTNGDPMSWLDPYTIASLASNYDVNQSFSLQLGINNIFDAGDSVNLPLEPFSFYLGMTANI